MTYEEVEAWVKGIVDDLRTKEERDVMVFNVERDMGVMMYLLRCLGNPDCGGSQAMVNAILERRNKLAEVWPQQMNR